MRPTSLDGVGVLSKISRKSGSTSQQRERRFFLTVLFSVLLFLPGSLLATVPLAHAQTFSPWNPHVSCTALLSAFRDVYGSGSLSSGLWQTSSTAGGVPNKRALSPPCSIRNISGQTLSSLVQINGVYLPSLTSEDCSTTFASVNGGGSYPDYNGDGKADSFCDSTGNIHPVGGSGSIHIEFDHDWKAAKYCGPGVPPCDPDAIKPYLSSGSISLDVQGFVYWDKTHWELHPFTGWKLSSSPPPPSPLAASFSYTPQTPSPGTSVSFTATATGGTQPYSFSWNFGDGGSATGNPVNHVFSAEGSFNVTLTVTDSGSSMVKTSQIVKVTNQISYVFTPTDDAYVQQDTPATNYGASTQITVDNSPVRNIMLKFNVQVIGTITGASLRLFQVDMSDRGGDFHTTPSNWTETTVNWNNAPAANPTVFFSLGSVSSNTWYNVDMTQVVTGSGIFSLRVTSPSTDGSHFSSKEGAQPPQLIVSTANVNAPPTLSVPSSLTVNEQSLVSFKVNATDDPSQTITLSASGLPAGAGFTSSPGSGSVSGTFTWTPSETQGPGDYTAGFTATDNTGLSSTKSVGIHVNEVNRSPSLTVPGSQTVVEGSPLTFTVTGTDPDLPANSLTYSASSLPSGSSFNPATRTFSWTPTTGQSSGSPYTVSFTVTDNGSPPLSDTKTVSITVLAPSTNNPPTLNIPGAQTVNEGSPLTFTVTSSDPDTPVQTVTLSASGLPSGASFPTVNGNPVTGTLSWTPSEAQGPGSYMVTFQATDSLGASITASVSITVNEVNTAPVVNAPASTTIGVNSTLTITVTGTDGDIPVNTVTLTTSGLVTGMSFTPTNGNPATGTFTFTPGPSQAGMSLTVTFTATDNGNPSLFASKNVGITVTGGINGPTYALVASSDGRVYRYYQNQTLLLVGQSVTSILRQVAWKPDGSYALIVGESAVLIKYDGSQLTVIPANVSSTVAFFTVAWKPDASYALIGGSNGVVLKYDGSSTVSIQNAVSSTIRAITWNPSGSRALLAGSSGTLLLYEASTGQLQALSSGTSANFYSAAWNPNGLYALAAGTNGLLAKYDGTSVTIITTTGVYNSALVVRYIAWNPTGTLALLTGDSGLLLTYDGTALTALTSGTTNGLYSIAWLGSTATIVGNNGTVLTYSNGVLQALSPSTTSSFRGIAWKP